MAAALQRQLLQANELLAEEGAHHARAANPSRLPITLKYVRKCILVKMSCAISLCALSDLVITHGPFV